jgi:predicted DsbA family dithiol-disulfide isomerase
MMRIEVFHDIACPWCRVGKHHLRMALKDWQGEPIQVDYRPFFLNADIPADGYNFREYMRAKGGGDANLERWFAAPRNTGAAIGIKFDFEKIEFAPNTLLSHTLIAATPQNMRDTLIDNLYDAYFAEGLNIGDVDVLIACAARVGVDTAHIRQQLMDAELKRAVIHDAQQSMTMGVTSVPLFLFNRRYALQGAQPPNALREVIERVIAMETT